MISKSKVAQIADEVIEAARRDRVWPRGYGGSLPYWFKGPHLAGLSHEERRSRLADMSRRALNRPGWVLAALAGVAAVIALDLLLAPPHAALLVMWPAIIVMAVRHCALRLEFRRDAQAFTKSNRPPLGGTPT